MKQFNAASLQDIDRGKVALAVNHALKQCVLDIEDRPADKTKRKVTLEINLAPSLDPDLGQLDTVEIDFKIDTKLPSRVSTVYPMLPSSAGTLNFNPDSPNDPRQGTFFSDEPTQTEQEDK